MTDPTDPADDKKPASNSALMGGVVLILVGVVFLLQQTAGINLQNWWALFILIPAVMALGAAWNMYRADGRLSPRVLGTAAGSLFPLLIAAIFLFGLDWGSVWPVFLIVAGIGGLLGRGAGR